jgi:hypothetical protein
MGDPRPGLPPTERQIHIFATYVREGSLKAAAKTLGLAESTVKNQMAELHRRLDVCCAMGAAQKLCWIRIPGDEHLQECKWTGYCSRPLGHLGHHGAMRALVPANI